jgi:hypothetical protein
MNIINISIKKDFFLNEIVQLTDVFLEKKNSQLTKIYH